MSFTSRTTQATQLLTHESDARRQTDANANSLRAHNHGQPQRTVLSAHTRQTHDTRRTDHIQCVYKAARSAARARGHSNARRAQWFGSCIRRCALVQRYFHIPTPPRRRQEPSASIAFVGGCEKLCARRKPSFTTRFHCKIRAKKTSKSASGACGLPLLQYPFVHPPLPHPLP